MTHGKAKPTVNPHVHSHIAESIQEEGLALLSLLRFNWYWFALLFLGIVILVSEVHPFPPKHIRLATGQPNSSLEALGKVYADHFQKMGVELEIVNTNGASDSIDYLKRGKADVALSIVGIPLGENAEDIASLGSIEYQPFWLFYRGSEFTGNNPSQFFSSKRLSVNLRGSGTYHIAEQLLELHKVDIRKENFVSMSSSDSVEALLAGKIDGFFLVAGIDSGAIQRALSNPAIKIFDFAVADAYTRRVKFLDTVTLPHGAIDLASAVPPNNVRMIATTTTILVKKDLHPAIQQMFLRTAKQLDASGRTFFSKPGGFPAYMESDAPLTEVARRYYAKGPPMLEGYAPFWLASLLDQIWFMLFALFAIGYPLIKIFPNTRSFYTHMCIVDCYHELTEIDKQLMTDLNGEALKMCIANFDALEKRINQLWIPAALQGEFYNLKNSVEIVRARSVRVLFGLDHLGHGPAKSPSAAPAAGSDHHDLCSEST